MITPNYPMIILLPPLKKDIELHGSIHPSFWIDQKCINTELRILFTLSHYPVLRINRKSHTQHTFFRITLRLLFLAILIYFCHLTNTKYRNLCVSSYLYLSNTNSKGKSAEWALCGNVGSKWESVDSFQK